METKKLKDWMQDNLRRNLGKDYEYLVDYFETLMDDTADYIILISRRCYILYQMFAFILDWERKNVISDKGMWCNRIGLGKAARVIIADDLMFSGAAVSRILKKMDIYLERDCVRKVAVFCRYNDCRGNIEGCSVKAYSVRTERDCKKLTNKLVKSIQSNGMPYAVFVYSLYGVEKPQKVNSWQETQQIDGSNIFDRSGNEWDSKIYFNPINEVKRLKDTICDEVCLRVYRKVAQNLICVIPFAFLKDIRKNYLERYFGQIQQCFKRAGGNLIASEIELALGSKETILESEKFIYLASMVSCCLSRIVGILFNVENMCVERIELISDNIIRGSFSNEVVNELNNMDVEFALRFINELNNYADVLRECVQLEEDNVCLDPHYEVLVETEKVNKRCGDILVDIFEDMRERYNEKEEEYTKYISCDKIISLLKGAYSKEEIYAAEIRVWDQGIATYDFGIDASGLKSRCGIGERSQLIFSLKYQPVLETFFERLPYERNEYTQEQINNDIEEILTKANNLSSAEKSMFRKAVQCGITDLYNCFIEI